MIPSNLSKGRWLIATTLAVAQLADVATTEMFLRQGKTEANPLMVGAMTHLGAFWWAPKMLLAGFVFYMILCSKRWMLPTACAVVSIFPPLWNILP